MIDITTPTVYPIEPINFIARELLDIATSGVSIRLDTAIHLIDESQANQDIAQDILDNFDSLTVTASATNINEGDPDPVITCNDSAIVNDAEIGWVVIVDGDIYADGTTTVTGGTATLTLIAPSYGIYDIYLYRLVSNYSSGSITITVNEV